jgi:signal transduction histidine kinase/CheY-like chemotaxis protein
MNYRKDGTSFWNGLSISPIRDTAEQVAHFVGVLTDISPLKLLEKKLLQSQKMEAIGQLAAGVAHDFNNLLTIISGYSELLLGTLTSNDPRREGVEAISEAGERAAGLTRQLLSFSRQSILEMKVVDLNGVIHETEKLLRRMIGEDIVLTTVPDPNLSLVKVDPGQMGQVLMNLAINARDAMPLGGSLTIETSNVELGQDYVAMHPDCPAGSYVKVAVSDDGSGMSPAVQAHIFEPFFTTKKPGKGSGLGLATVYGIVKQSGGSINLYSELGHGTTFKIYLPAIEEPVRSINQTQSSGKVAGGTETVLLVEDEDAVRAIIVLALQTQGYRVLAAESGKKALRLLEKHREDLHLLVTDVIMPEMSGRELAEALSAKYPGLKVLYLSGYTDDSVIRHGILQAEVAFLQKPFTPLTLARKIREVLDK